MTIINQLNSLHRKVVESPFLEVFKKWLDKGQNNLIQTPSHMNGWVRWSFKAPSNLQCPMILWSGHSINFCSHFFVCITNCIFAVPCIFPYTRYATGSFSNLEQSFFQPDDFTFSLSFSPKHLQSAAPNMSPDKTTFSNRWSLGV